jgi:hypothetical protein
MLSRQTAKLTGTALMLFSGALLMAPGAGIGRATRHIAQPERLDVGSFTIFVHGQRVGREQFSMLRTSASDGVVFELRSESASGDRRTAVRLETDSAGTPVRYSVEERQGAVLSLRLGGQRVRGRFATLSRSATGESAREYLLAADALVLEDEGLLQYALFVRRPIATLDSARRVNVLTPIANRQSVATLILESKADTVAIAGSKRQANRWKLLTATDEVRLVWADADGRLLRIHIPSRGLDAIRDDVPRSNPLYPF